MNPMFLVTLGFAFATLAVLVFGVVLMTVGGEANRKYGAKLMMMRVILQGCTLATLFFAFASKS